MKKEQTDQILKLPDQISIPKLKVTAPLIKVNGTSNADFILPLKKGVALYPLSEPGQQGRTVILGHSAPAGWPKINYDWVFSDLGHLIQGDEIKITYQGKEYIYTVKNKIILKKGQELPDSKSSEELILITCWPPGIDHRRLIILAQPKIFI